MAEINTYRALFKRDRTTVVPNVFSFNIIGSVAADGLKVLPPSIAAMHSHINWQAEQYLVV